MENQQQEREMTPEELMARKEEMKAFFTEAVPFLEAQYKYEKLLAEISEFKFKRLQYDVQYTTTMYNMQHPEEEETEERYKPEAEKPAKRPLKKS